MSSSSSFRRLTTNFHQSPPSISKPPPLPPQSFPISPQKHPLSKSFTIQSSPPTKPIIQTKSNPQILTQIPKKLQEIITLFQSEQNPYAKFNQLLFYGKKLKPLHTQFKSDQNKVKGCVSQVWIRAYFDNLDDKNVVFEADSDAFITKGLAALLVQGLSGCRVEEILRISPDFVIELGFQQSLSRSRNNGFLNMFELMQKKALMLYVEAEKGIDLGFENVENEKKEVDLDSKSLEFELSTNPVVDNVKGNGLGLGSRGLRIREIISEELKPIELEVNDVSYQHAGHAGVKGSNGETHFDLKVVSKEFEGKSLVKRHRLVHSLLNDELQNGLHALSIEAKTPAEVGI